MTENEAIKLGKALYENITNNANNIIPTKEYIEFIGMAIQTLEEIQQYSAIGTVEEIRTAMKYVSLVKKHGTVGKAIDSCAEYESIGTVEEFKALKEKSVAKKDFSGCICNNVERERKEIRNKAIDEFVERVKEVYPFTILELEQLDKTANEMRCAE